MTLGTLSSHWSVRSMLERIDQTLSMCVTEKHAEREEAKSRSRSKKMYMLTLLRHALKIVLIVSCCCQSWSWIEIKIVGFYNAKSIYKLKRKKLISWVDEKKKSSTQFCIIYSIQSKRLFSVCTNSHRTNYLKDLSDNDSYFCIFNLSKRFINNERLIDRSIDRFKTILMQRK